MMTLDEARYGGPEEELFIPTTSELGLSDHQAALLAPVHPDLALSRAEALLNHFPESATYQLLRQLPGSLLVADFNDVFARLVALGAALGGAPVGEVLQLAVASPGLLLLEAEEVAATVASLVAAVEAHLRPGEFAASSRTLIRAVVSQRPELLQVPLAQLVARVRLLAGCEAARLSDNASAAAAGGYSSREAARKLAAWLCADQSALRARAESLAELRGQGEHIGSPLGAGFDALSDLWVYQSASFATANIQRSLPSGQRGPAGKTRRGFLGLACLE
ncbi:hypothetical protein GPECTOR_40g530 [Gonium pectorale]|uniref:Uncharacterized protein n=1 Tax=Gonium pectorale TaxID=33097 RepID=A0A150GAB8_GONPE|nr:hypothetical protein GPECTOR_40g530 [Gonium pectorale]|eukprot:KXZ46796.1 hypothetical protein GPECTOR_40g530 [Gonium pectorale]